MATSAPPLACGSSGSGTEWLWEALASCRHAHSVVTQLAPADFDWNSVHAVYGTPLMATVNEIVRSGQVHRDVKPVLHWCMRQGADPRRVAVTARGYSGGWGNGTEEFPHVPRVGHAARSAITLALGLIAVLERISVYEHKGKYQDQLSAAKALLGVFAQYRPCTPCRPVADGAVEMWERILADQESADVELRVAEQCGPADADPEPEAAEASQSSWASVHAHSLVLCQASPVLRALLASDMRESQTRMVQVPGASVAAVRLLLTIVYSGGLQDSDSYARRRSRTSSSSSFSGYWNTWGDGHGGSGFAAGSAFAVGDAVEANWRGRGRWWPGRVVAVNDDGTYSVDYDGAGSFSDRRVAAANLRSSKDSSSSSSKGGKGGSGNAADCPRTLLEALDVAHRWQISHAVALLEQSLAQHVRDGLLKRSYGRTGARWGQDWDEQNAERDKSLRTFELLCEAAALQELPTLRAACLRRAGECPEVRRYYEHGYFGHIASRELRSVFD